jgi:hypothetical protein
VRRVLAISAESKTETALAGLLGGPMSANKFTESLTRQMLPWYSSITRSACTAGCVTLPPLS